MAEKIMPNGKEELTPMMKQFRDIKTQYPDAMLLFRCGDFYETYAEDAVKASKILNITLTHRSNGGSSAAPGRHLGLHPDGEDAEVLHSEGRR